MRLVFALCLMAASAVSAQNIKFPAPSKKGGKTIVETLWSRQSKRSFSSKALPTQLLGDLLWAANGVSREDGKRTNPTARNVQEISIYAFMAKGVYLYNAQSHTLELKAKGDHRSLVAGAQTFVNDAPVSLVIVGDYEKMGKGTHAKEMVAIDAGVACENISLFCAGMGLCTVPRATMNQPGIQKLLGLTSQQMPLMNNPVGYDK